MDADAYARGRKCARALDMPLFEINLVALSLNGKRMNRGYFQFFKSSQEKPPFLYICIIIDID